MNGLFESIKQGLNEAIEYEQNKLTNVKVDKISIKPLHIYSRTKIKEIRERQKMTQKLFAQALGVSVKTVESWETGTNKPSGSASRLLELLDNENELFEKCSIIART